MDNKTPRGIPVMSFKLAKHLLALNYRIKDIKPNFKDSKRTVFIFEPNNEIMNKIKEYTRNNYENK